MWGWHSISIVAPNGVVYLNTPFSDGESNWLNWIACFSCALRHTHMHIPQAHACTCTHKHSESWSAYVLQYFLYGSLHFFVCDILLILVTCLQYVRKTERSGCEASQQGTCFNKACPERLESTPSLHETLLIQSDRSAFPWKPRVSPQEKLADSVWQVNLPTDPQVSPQEKLCKVTVLQEAAACSSLLLFRDL